MKRVLTIAMAASFAVSLALGQTPAATGASAAGLVVGSGNYFSPIVRDLDAAIAFYRDGLGLEVQGPPGDAGGPGAPGQPGQPGGDGDSGGDGGHGACDHCPPPRTAPGY